MRWGVFAGIYALQLLVSFPRFLQTCEGLDTKRLVVYFTHHATDVYLFWSVLFVTSAREALLHLIFAVLVLAHWVSYDNKCIATVYLNHLCGQPEEEWLDSLLNRSGLRSVSDYYQFVWVAGSILVNSWLTLGKSPVRRGRFLGASGGVD